MAEPKIRAIFERILEIVDDGIHVVDRHGTTIFYNKQAAKFDDMEGKEVLGRKVLDVFPHLTEETSTLLEAVKTGKPTDNQHHKYLNSQDEWINTVNKTLPIIIDGEIAGAVEIAKDVTSIRNLSSSLIDLQSRVERRAKEVQFKDSTGAMYEMDQILTNNEAFKRLKEQALRVAETNSPILVYGETGTGKELLVQSLHNASPRRNAPFIAQNCAAIPSALLEGILFGTSRGSYTGATDRPGLFELANGGTLFLDEINSMPMDTQAKLLRVLQSTSIRRVGGTKEHHVDVRVIAALNEPAHECVEQKTLRADLYYRLNVINLSLPPLRERKEDIPLLVNHFIRKFNRSFGRNVTEVSERVMGLLMAHDWPGNVRELEHVVESAMNLVEGNALSLRTLPPQLRKFPERMRREGVVPLREALAKKEQKLIAQAMAVTRGNVTQAAKMLDIPRQTLQYKLTQLEKRQDLGDLTLKSES